MPVSINGNTGVITGISAGGLPDGCIVDADINGMAASKLSGALPAISGASLTGISAGITHMDQWRITSNFNGSQNPVANNWERNDTQFSTLGTGFSAPSSGIWTFPVTGVWSLQFKANFSLSSQTSYLGVYIYLTSDNSNYNMRAIAYSGRAENYASANTDPIIINVTDLTNQKFRMDISTSNSSSNCLGDTGMFLTGITMIRLGDPQ